MYYITIQELFYARLSCIACLKQLDCTYVVFSFMYFIVQKGTRNCSKIICLPSQNSLDGLPQSNPILWWNKSLRSKIKRTIICREERRKNKGNNSLHVHPFVPLCMFGRVQFFLLLGSKRFPTAAVNTRCTD